MNLRQFANRTAVGIAAAALSFGAGGAATASGPAPGADEVDTQMGVYKKVYKNVWKEANSFASSNGTSPGTAGKIVWKGKMRGGSNYFYCQVQTDAVRTAGNGSLANNWWLLTDDDSGNSAVWVNAVNVSGGDNYEPVPGLTHC